MEVVPASSVDIFNKPARILVSGFSGCGKSVLVGKIIKKYIDSFTEIIISGSENFPVEAHPKIIIHSGERAYDPFAQNINDGKHRLLIYDDYMLDNESGKTIAKVYIKGRHLSSSCIYIAQNILHNSLCHKAIALNCCYFLLLRMRNIAQIKHFARFFFR